ncbi:MAG: DUF5067 domain-containing protein [Eubacterium sp.]|nr:DUF5067 domain-containing protein [Eubacterium sp.]
MNENKNSVLGILALIFSVLGCTFLIGVILAIIDLTKNDGRKKALSIIALVISGIWLIVGLVGGASRKKNTADNQTVTTESASDDTASSDESNDSGNEVASSDENDVSADEKTTASEYYFRDNEVVVSDYTIKITDYKVIPVGEAGNEYGKNPVIAFWYDTTNTSGKEIDPMSAWIYIMEAVQDNNPNAVNKLEVGLLPDSQYSESQLEKIKQGGTVSNAIAYELTDLETPVELTARNGLLGDELGTMTFEIK